jgi:hypothetical protein
VACLQLSRTLTTCSKRGNARRDLGKVRLRAFIAADVIVFVVAAVTYVVLFPSNVDSRDPSPIYSAAFWSGAVSLISLIILGLVQAARHLRHPRR